MLEGPVCLFYSNIYTDYTYPANVTEMFSHCEPPVSHDLQVEVTSQNATKLIERVVVMHLKYFFNYLS